MLAKINAGILALSLGGMLVTGAMGGDVSPITKTFTNAIPSQFSSMLPSDMSTSMKKVDNTDKKNVGFSKEGFQKAEAFVSSGESVVKEAQANGLSRAESARQKFEAKRASNNEMMKSLQNQTPVLSSSKNTK